MLPGKPPRRRRLFSVLSLAVDLQASRPQTMHPMVGHCRDPSLKLFGGQVVAAASFFQRYLTRFYRRHHSGLTANYPSLTWNRQWNTSLSIFVRCHEFLPSYRLFLLRGLLSICVQKKRPCDTKVPLRQLRAGSPSLNHARTALRGSRGTPISRSPRPVRRRRAWRGHSRGGNRCP